MVSIALFLCGATVGITLGVLIMGLLCARVKDE